MKKVLFGILCLLSLNLLAQDAQPAFDGAKWHAPYTLASPTGWDVERFPIPISFAPAIPYKGVEDIRFTPGWAKVNTDEYWSYAFLWYLDGKQAMTPQIIETNLKAYYTGLVGMNIESRKIPADKLVQIKTSFKEVKKDKGDLKTFHGTVYMLDYMEQKPMILNCIIHLRSCPARDNTFVFNEISPQPYGHKTWQALDQLWTGFSCSE